MHSGNRADDDRTRGTITRALCLVAAGAARADPVLVIEDTCARASGPTAPTGAAYLTIRNDGDSPDRLTGVASKAAARVELHTHQMDAAGVMRMRPVDGGIEIPPGGTHRLARGGEHVIFMGLTRPFLQGETVAVTLSF